VRPGEREQPHSAVAAYRLSGSILVNTNLQAGACGSNGRTKPDIKEHQVIPILLAGLGHHRARKLVDEAGALGFINKPFVSEQVVAAVKAALTKGAIGETN